MAEVSRVLRIPQASGGQDSFVLVQVTRDGPSPLDLKKAHLAKIRAKNYNGPEDEWEHMLTSSILPRTGEKCRAEETTGVELMASVAETKEIIITIRKNQRLGSIPLRHDQAQEIELFDWAGQAAKAAAAVEDEKTSLVARAKGHDESIAELTRHLDELIRAKDEHEKAVLEKFQELLNSKKRKIREQQRLLDGVKLDGKDSALSTSSGGDRPSRLRKRKAGASGDSPSPGRSEADDANGTDAEGGSSQTTPEPSDRETAEEESDGYDSRPPIPPTQKDKVVEPRASETRQSPPQKQRADPPPRRELPFPGTGDTSNDPRAADPFAKAAGPSTISGDETATDDDDDEL
ncbi:MAG: hypothetical protein M1815_005347 [Lichina confinis]|nr:MAG: hypothetical protein M1815_005347 [Lichina confinis]